MPDGTGLGTRIGTGWNQILWFGFGSDGSGLDLGSIRFRQIPSDSIRFRQIPSDSVRFHQIASDSVSFCQILSESVRSCRRRIQCKGRCNIPNVRLNCAINFRSPHSFCCYLFHRSTPSTTANLLHSNCLFFGKSPQRCTTQAKRPHHHYGLSIAVA